MVQRNPLFPTIHPVVQSLPHRAAGLTALVSGLVLWAIGARYTVLGIPAVVTLVLGLFGIKGTLLLPSAWSLVGLTGLIGMVISLVEFGCRPHRRQFSTSLVSGLIFLLIWLLTNSADLSSTFIGVTSPHADSWPMTFWVASTRWAAASWTMFLTYCPELLMIAGLRWLIRGSV